MKNILNFRAGALVLGLVLAFAGSGFTAAHNQTYWFEASEDGEMVGDYIPAPSCSESEGDYCALGFDSEDLEDPNASTPVLKSEVQADPLSYNDAEARIRTN